MEANDEEEEEERQNRCILSALRDTVCFEKRANYCVKCLCIESQHTLHSVGIIVYTM